MPFYICEKTCVYCTSTYLYRILRIDSQSRNECVAAAGTIVSLSETLLVLTAVACRRLALLLLLLLCLYFLFSFFFAHILSSFLFSTLLRIFPSFCCLPSVNALQYATLNWLLAVKLRVHMYTYNFIYWYL